MSTANELHTAGVTDAFDAVASEFESTLENDVTRRIRQMVYARVTSLVPAGSAILDINCGIGIDAIELAKRGYKVSGADISPQMIQQARLRATTNSLNDIEFHNTSFENLAPFYGQPFNLVLSNFGGLNCVSALETVAQHLRMITEPGGYFVAVVMPPLSLWECVAGLAKLNVQFAFRRLQRNVQATGFGKNTFTVSYFSPRRFTRAFRGTFETVHIQGINIISPPPHATTFVKRFPRLVRWLERIERSIASLPILRALGDHYMIIMRRREAPQHFITPNINLTPVAVKEELEHVRRKAHGLDENPSFSQFLKGKRVALVGPARTLVGKGLGAEIDSYDVVVRINEAFEFLGSSEQLRKDFGQRADIYYINQAVIRKNILVQQKLLCNVFSLGPITDRQKFLVYTNNSLDYLATGEPSPKCPQSDEHVLSAVKDLIAQEGSNIGFRLVYTANEMLIRYLRGNFPRTGLVAITDLLSFDIDQLFIAGMTFYHGGGHLLIDQNAQLNPLKNRDGSWAHDQTGFGHNSHTELRLMSILMRAFQIKLRVDEGLEQVLSTYSTTMKS